MVPLVEIIVESRKYCSVKNAGLFEYFEQVIITYAKYNLVDKFYSFH